nr:putative uncharacterized protein DDB_G0279653 [Pelodiscus sinensis]|eukprot:XP_006119044.1 putative uncharacterized protein DDB_G0279653 [Pelodiscus sinensis]
MPLQNQNPAQVQEQSKNLKMHPGKKRSPRRSHWTSLLAQSRNWNQNQSQSQSQHQNQIHQKLKKQDIYSQSSSNTSSHPPYHLHREQKHPRNVRKQNRNQNQSQADAPHPSASQKVLALCNHPHRGKRSNRNNRAAGPRHGSSSQLPKGAHATHARQDSDQVSSWSCPRGLEGFTVAASELCPVRVGACSPLVSLTCHQAGSRQLVPSPLSLFSRKRFAAGAARL